MGRIEWLKWRMSFGSRKSRARQLRLFLAFEVYYQLCKLSGYGVNHFLEWQGKPVPEGAQPMEGKYILVWPRLPLPIRLLDRLFRFGRLAHAEHIPYTPEMAEEIKSTGRRAELVEIRYELRSGGSSE
ncbi:MAG TPA: hypothetical protein VEZ40_04290 [Pyrinomonadaceae bacterium]|nr:hypothetical protein [Pyrinomonadaceae bacterium]